MANLFSLLRVQVSLAWPGCILAAALLLPGLSWGQVPPVGAALNPDGTLRSGVQGSFDATGYQLSYGQGGQPVLRTAAATNWISLDMGAANGVSGTVQALAVSGSTVYVGGTFITAGGITANNVAQWDGTRWSSLGTGAANGVNSTVQALAVSGSTLYVGGEFIKAGGATARYVARWDGTSWSSLGADLNGIDNVVYALAMSGSTLYVGGVFGTAGGATASRVAQWDETAAAWSSLGVGSANGVGGTVTALAVSGSTLYVGGHFSTAGGTTANYVAQWNTTTSAWSSLGTGLANGVGSLVTALAVSGNTLHVGGYFTTAGGAAANRVAQWNRTTSVWGSVGTGLANGVSNTVLALAVSGSTLYAGGQFLTAGGATANRVARWDGTSWSTLATNPDGVSSTLYALALNSDGLYAGGSFTTAGNVAANYVALYPPAAIPLPVQLVAFTATASGPAAVRLTWATASEVNSARFEVERSLDGIRYHKIGEVAAAGTSLSRRTYELTDNRLPLGAGVLYYRLRQVDADGTAAYSLVQAVALNQDSAGPVLYPNPSRDGAATVVGLAAGASVVVHNALGRVVAAATASVEGTASLGGLAPGLYVVHSGGSSVRLTVE